MLIYFFYLCVDGCGKAISLAKLRLFCLGGYVLSYFKTIEEYMIVLLFSVPCGASNKPQASFFIFKIMLLY